MARSVPTDALRDLIGRELESERIAAVVEGLPAGGAALVLRGEPGIGKSAVPRGARERAEAAGGRGLLDRLGEFTAVGRDLRQRERERSLPPARRGCPARLRARQLPDAV